ncbi:thermonuclease family protein [Staphylococcus capitis]|uniref:thermonuclease family protein n=1 Tax=Staphylococcus capitis TaxID=29388 RepID=UPI001BCDD5C5|nr:thermonuclease family protein [Staphylococcus capitis]
MADYSHILEQLYTFKADCYKVIDGDTIACRLSLGFDTYQDRHLRVLDVDTPEHRQEHFDDAKQFTARAVLGKEILVQTYKADNFGRYLANVYYPTDDGYKLLSDELKQAGLVKPNSKWNV